MLLFLLNQLYDAATLALMYYKSSVMDYTNYSKLEKATMFFLQVINLTDKHSP